MRRESRKSEAERLLKLAREANLGSTVYKSQTEIWVGWQCSTQEQAEAARNFMSDLRILLSGAVSASSETGPSDPSFSYRGLAYARPIGRGVVLEELDGQPHLEDVLPEGDYDIEIKAFRRLSER